HVSSLLFFFSSRRRHTRFSRDWSSDVCSSDLVLGQATEAHLGVAELALDHPERVLDLGSYLRLGLLDLAFGLVQGTAFAQLLIGTAARRDLPNHFEIGRAHV